MIPIQKSINSCHFGLLILVFLSSCIEVGNTDDIGDGFGFGYYSNTKLTSNIYYNSTGIFRGTCDEIKWNSDFILATVTLPKSNSPQLFLVNKKKYINKPMQMESDAVIGPIPYDSLNIVLDLNHVGMLDKQKKTD